MRGVSLDRFHELRHEIESLLELNVDVGERLMAVLAQRDQPVVNRDHEKRDKTGNRQENHKLHKSLRIKIGSTLYIVLHFTRLAKALFTALFQGFVLFLGPTCKGSCGGVRNS
jgi:hypothetical protein